jgi:hypothetical protein
VAQWKPASPDKTVPNWLGLTTQQRQAAQYQWAMQGAELLKQYVAQNPNWQQGIQTAAQKAADAYAQKEFDAWMQSTGQPALDLWRQQALQGESADLGRFTRRSDRDRLKKMKHRKGSRGLIGGELKNREQLSPYGG